MQLIIALLLFSGALFAQSSTSDAPAQEDIIVGLSPTLPYLDVSHQGIPVRVRRVQDPKNRLVDDFSKTSRPCPPFCIHPMEAAAGVTTVGELELLDFLRNEVDNGQGILVDARMPKFFNSETIPGSVNIPFVLFTTSPDKLFPLLGATPTDNGFDFSTAKELLLYCNGPWCDQSPRAIKGLIQAGYPSNKLRYYRGGMQLWKILSLTTVQPISNAVGAQ